MKFKYTGDEKETTLRGVTFRKGKATAVKDDLLAAKLSNLEDFEEVKASGNKG